MSVLILAVFAVSVVSDGSNEQQSLKWKKHYDSAKQTAQASARPLVVVLENPSKTTGKIDESKLTDHDRKKLAQEKFELVRVDVNTDYGKQVAEAFGATTFPYTAVTDERSVRIVFRKAGQMSEKDWTLALAKSSATAAPPQPHLSPDDQPVTRPAQIDWLRDFSSAVAKSQQIDRPIFLYITAPGCTYCEIMKREAFSQLQFIDDINREFVPVQINGREQTAIAQRFQVRVYPTIAIVEPGGTVVDSWNGYKSLSDFQAHLTLAKSKLLNKFAADTAAVDSFVW